MTILRHLAATVAGVALVCLSPLATSGQGSQVMAVRAERLIDGSGSDIIRPGVVVIEGDRIVDVGDESVIPRDATMLDLGNATLLPGLIDLHTHLTDEVGLHWEEVLVTTTPALAALHGAANAHVTLLAGFTTCRDMGPTWPFTDVDLRDVIDQGALPDPRLQVPGNYVSSTGGAGNARQFSISTLTCRPFRISRTAWTRFGERYAPISSKVPTS